MPTWLVPFVIVPGSVLLAALSSPKVVSIRVDRPVVMAGGDLAVTCRVPPEPWHRELQAGLPEYYTSTRQLDGADAPLTFRFEYHHIPCVVESAICAVKDNDGKITVASTPIQVAGCEP